MEEDKQTVRIGFVVEGIDVGADVASLLAEPHSVDRKELSQVLERILPGKVGNYYESIAKAIVTRTLAADALSQALEYGVGSYHIYAPTNYPGCIAGKETESQSFAVKDGLRYLASHYEIPASRNDGEHIVPPCGPGCLCAVHCNY